MYETNLIIVITHCPVCGKRHDPPVHVYEHGDEARMVNETCEECWTWFRLEEFAAVVRQGDAFDPKWSGPYFCGEVAHV